MIARAAFVSRNVTICAPALGAHGMLSGRLVPSTFGIGFCTGFNDDRTWSKS